LSFEKTCSTGFQIWRVFPQEEELGAGGVDRAPDGGGLMAAEVDGVDAPSRHRCAKVVSLIIT
jgi:hypothetical protein